MKFTWWDKLCAGVYAFYLIIRYGIKGTKKITDEAYKTAVELNKRLLEKLNEKNLF